MSIKKSIILSLVFLLTSSSFFLPHYLNNKILSGDFNSQQLQFSLEIENEAALLWSLNKAPMHSELWIHLAKKLAKTQGNVAFKLAKYSESKNKYKQAVIWYQQAIRLEHSSSYIALAQMYFNQLELSKSQQVLDSFSQFTSKQPLVLPSLTNISSKMKALENRQAVILKIQIAIHQGDDEKISSYINNSLALLKGNKKGQKLLDDINTFKILKKPSLDTIKLFSLNKTCSISLQMFATNLLHLKQVQTLIQSFQTQPLAGFICLPTPRYISLSTLSCDDNKNSAIQCSESQWNTLASTINTRYIGVMLPQGGANVHLGMLYIDAKDNVDVFSHELSHLLGFIDEYPLPENHAKCENIQPAAFSHNVAVLKESYQGERALVRAKVLAKISWGKAIKETTLILQKSINKNQEKWVLGTPLKYKNEVGVFPAKSCEKSRKLKKLKARAYQPLNISTQLLHFEEAFPDKYIDFIKNQTNQFLMPSFHYNIALAFFQKGNLTKAKYWLKQAAKKEMIFKRRKRILLGDY